MIVATTVPGVRRPRADRDGVTGVNDIGLVYTIDDSRRRHDP
ncbi:hypothetical protein [Halosimplex marinum]